MRDILPDTEKWDDANVPMAVATVIETWGSSPREVGAKMVVTANGDIAGSVSGGCVEAAVAEAAQVVIASGAPQLLHFGVADETAWEVGLACGGSMDVFVEPCRREWYVPLRDSLQAEQAVAAVTVLSGDSSLGGKLVATDSTSGGTMSLHLAAAALQAAQEALRRGQSGRVQLSESVEAFAEVHLPPPTLIIVGGVHIAIALAKLAKTLGYRTVVIDPRKAFGNAARFAHADVLIQTWADEALADMLITRTTAIAMLTHDPKLDDPALKVALPSDAFYVGALGSRATQQTRRQRLLAEGVPAGQLDRLRGPIGLNIGARSPEEIALAIMAEIVSAQRARPPLP